MDTSVPARPARRWARAAWILLPALAFFGLLVLGTVRKGSAPVPGTAAPQFRAELLSGSGTLALEDLRGTPVFLNFWASWCAPCEDEAPMLRKAHELYGDRIAFVGINIRDSRTDAVEFAAEHDLDFTHVRDEGLRIYDDYGLTGQPESFFIDSDGTIVEHIPGTIPNEDRLLQMLDLLVGRDA